jgi:hypothetical protein
MARAIGKTPFDIARKQTRPVVQGTINWEANEVFAAIASPKYIVAGSGSTAAGQTRGTFGQVGGFTSVSGYNKPTDQAGPWLSGDILEVVGWATPKDFANLTANHRLGIVFGETDTSNIFINTNLQRKVGLWISSAGTIFAVSSAGVALTETSTGITAVHDTRFKFYVRYDGSSVSVSINDGALTTVSTNIPQYVSVANAGCGTSGAGSKTILLTTCFWQMQST